MIFGIDFPNFKKEKINIAVSDENLTIGVVYALRRERNLPAIKKMLTIPKHVNRAKATASCENGILSINFPKNIEDNLSSS